MSVEDFTGIAKMLSPDFKIPLCYSIVIFFQKSLIL